MITNPRVTWLLPVKNGMPYLTETLASIKAQTYRNWEVLAWDNGSTDGSIDELNRWIPERLPGKVVSNEPLPLGMCLARSVEMSQTELCARIDSDDVNLPQRLEVQVAYLLAHPNVAVLGSMMLLIDQNGMACKPTQATYPLEHDVIVDGMLTANMIGHPSVIFRKQAILKAGNYRDRGSALIEDYDMWLRVSCREKLANVNLPLIKYRVHQHSSTQISIRENRLNDSLKECLCDNALQTFGCSSRGMRLLCDRKHPMALLPILKIVSHLEKSNGRGKPWRRLRSPTFSSAAIQLTSPSDLISRITLAAPVNQSGSLLNELKCLLKSTVIQISILRSRQSPSLRQRERALKRWLLGLDRKGARIHPSIDFIGGPPYNIKSISICPPCKIDRECSIWLSDEPTAQPELAIGPAVVIGRNVYIGVFKPVSIGESAQIGAYSYIISGNHSYARRDIPIYQQGHEGAPIVIEQDVWIGTHVVILPGVTIGRGAIIAAHSLVNKSIPPYEVWGGVPAKYLKKRP